VLIAFHRGDFNPNLHAESVPFEFRLNDSPSVGVHLHGEGMSRADQHGHLHAPLQQPIRRLETDQTTAQHQGMASFVEVGDDAADIIGGAHGEDPLSIGAVNPQEARVGARGDEQSIIRHAPAAISLHHPPLPVDGHSLMAEEGFSPHSLVVVGGAERQL